MLESTYRQLSGAADSLVAIGQTKPRDEVRELHSQWQTQKQMVADKHQQLEDMLRQWRHLESGMEELLTWLKETRRELVRPLPLTFEEVQAALEDCKVSNICAITQNRTL